MGPQTVKALRLIRDYTITMPREFAKMMWPDSEGWQRVINVGHGASAGAGMPYAAAGFIGRLDYKGLCRWSYDRDTDRRTLYLTDKGREELATAEGNTK